MYVDKYMLKKKLTRTNIWCARQSLSHKTFEICSNHTKYKGWWLLVHKKSGANICASKLHNENGLNAIIIIRNTEISRNAARKMFIYIFF